MTNKHTMTHPDLIAVAEGLEDAANQCQHPALRARLTQGAAAARRAEKMRLVLVGIQSRFNASTPAVRSADELFCALADINRIVADALT